MPFLPSQDQKPVAARLQAPGIAHPTVPPWATGNAGVPAAGPALGASILSAGLAPEDGFPFPKLAQFIMETLSWIGTLRPFLRPAGYPMNNTLVVVPTYNERENLPALARRLFTLSVPVDLLVVDDGSPDGTGEIANQLAHENASVHVLHRKEKQGLGQAYVAGFKWALARDYGFVFELDGDLSHNPDDIPGFLQAAREADLVLGSRYLNGIRIINWSLSRLALSRSASMYVRMVTGMPFTDPTGGYKCFRRSALQALDLDAVQSDGYSFQIEITHKLWRRGMKIVEVPIIFTDRFQGRSKMSRQIIMEAFRVVWRLWVQNKFRRRPTAS